MASPDLAHFGGTLLGPNDVPAFELVNADSRKPLALVCEHAGIAIPEALSDLGLSQDALHAHIGWDIGAAAVARELSGILDAPLVLQNYSRLVIDCNRPITSLESIRETSDGVVIPGNLSLTEAERSQRFDEIFAPFQAAIDTILDRTPRRAIIAIHSFTPSLSDGIQRPWDIGFLFRKDIRTSHRLADVLATLAPDLSIGLNEPYQIDDASDWFVPHNGEGRQLPHSLIEIRNDHLASADACRRWAELIGRCIDTVLPEL